MLLLQKILRFPPGRKFSTATSTIFALSSGQGKCGVAVVRISGSNASDAILKMTRCKALPKPRMAVLQHITDPITQEELDRGLILWFPGPKSFTGEDSCEFQVHGGPAVVASVLSGLSKLKDFRPAEPGEFTKRAFFAGKLDLTEVEGLGDLIHAETELQRKQALMQMEGNLSKLYNSWRSVLLKNVASVEAYIDFSEEENIENNVLNLANESLSKLQKEIYEHLADGRRGQRLRDGVRTTIIGEPNVGKSSLLNALSQRPAAIVTPIAGTTRDIIELHINISGYPLILTDTAGLRDQTSDIVEKEGIRRAHLSIMNSDLIILVIDASKYLDIAKQALPPHSILKFLEDHIATLSVCDALNDVKEQVENKESDPSKPQVVIIFNKIDLLSNVHKENLWKMAEIYKNMICVSCTTEEGFAFLISVLTKKLKVLCGNPSRESPSLTQARHRHHLSECFSDIEKYFTFTTEQNIPIAAQRLRKALRHLGKITGTVSTEEILDVIFKDFCIGK